jgi:uncharacterized membrane protein YphA (DoxX/SURF4 family)
MSRVEVALLDDLDLVGRAPKARRGLALPSRWAKAKDGLDELDRRSIAIARVVFPSVARGALFVVFFWFGLVKLLAQSEAIGLARALTARTVGVGHFMIMFRALAIFECVIGTLCLIPRMVRWAIALLIVHMTVACAPLVLVPELTWQSALVPTMTGQYIIKNVLVMVAACGLLAHASPTSEPATLRSPGRITPR